MSTAQALSIPSSRPRASSINLRCLASHSLGRRRSTSNLNPAKDDAEDKLPVLDTIPATPSPAQDFQITVPDTLQASSNPSSSSSMLVVVASKFLQWFHMPTRHSTAWSAPSSPRSSSDEFVLPMSASTQESFVIPVPEKPPTKSLHWTAHLSNNTPIFLVILSLPVSTAVVLYSLSTLPIAMAWPRTLSDLAQLGRDLHGYSQSGPWPLAHVIAVMAISAIWKHAWSIPGSVLWNVLAGALFSPAFATIMLTALTTIGSACATLLAAPLAPFLSYMFPRALEMTRNALAGHSSDLTKDDDSSTKSAPWVRLSILRLIGVVPWSGINIACGVCGVSFTDCMLGTFIGCLPWTAVTCQIGDILQTVASTPSPTPQTVSSLLTSPEILLKLVFLSFLSLAPILGRDHLRAMIAPAASTVVEASDGRSQRASWVQEWRRKISFSSRSRTRDQAQLQTELDILVQEKRRLEELPS